MNIQCRTNNKKPLSVREAAVIFAAVVWFIATGWLFQFSPVAAPPLPPPEVARFLADVRTRSLPGWALSLMPFWSLWLDYQAYRKLPALTGWLRRYGLIVAASLGSSVWIFSQRVYPDAVAGGAGVSWTMVWVLLCILCVFRRSTESLPPAADGREPPGL